MRLLAQAACADVGAAFVHRRTGTLGSRKSPTDKGLDAVAASSRLERSKRRSPVHCERQLDYLSG
jgi:hypothetical protein